MSGVIPDGEAVPEPSGLTLQTCGREPGKEDAMSRYAAVRMRGSGLASALTIFCVVLAAHPPAWAEKPDPVVVENPETNPVMVRDVDRPTHEPFQMRVPVSLPENSAVGYTNTEVPEGKRLVIENVSALVSVPIGQGVTRIGVSTEVIGYGLVEHFFPSQFQTTRVDGEGDIFIAAQPTRLYADTQFTVYIQRDGYADSASGAVVISGYLEDRE